MPKILLVDNYDSFTWNLYEYLSRLGADVDVRRNDKFELPDLDEVDPDLVVISPGPGHPRTDSGLSRDVIRKYAGKKPILGVCMGLQCIVDVFGGEISFAGEIHHGKTSPLTHNNTGVFKGTPQGTVVTRYHSLAAQIQSLPDCFEVTATSPGGVIQGVRHKEMLIEGLQFHPESIMSEDGMLMLKNFLAYEGGSWKVKKQESILDKIYAQRKLDVAEQEKVPGASFDDIVQSLELGIAPKQIDFAQRLRESDMALLAEVKRASPSKGPIGMHVHAATQARLYGSAGASAISVLTEPHWFKGSIEDMRQARLAVDSITNRPAILRKEFVFCKYQIAEARLFGADTVLLIVKMLSDEQLRELIDYSRSLGMEPLVEVSDSPEMDRAIALGSKVIGVNNRDLHSFKVDMNTTSSLVSKIPDGTLLIALSGISGPQQVRDFKKQGAHGVLVGESLMRAKNTREFIEDLMSP